MNKIDKTGYDSNKSIISNLMTEIQVSKDLLFVNCEQLRYLHSNDKSRNCANNCTF